MAVRKRKKPWYVCHRHDLYFLCGLLAVGIIVLLVALPGADDITVQPTEAPVTATPAPTATPEPIVNQMLPVLSRADVSDKRVAVTVDDINQPANLAALLDLCEQYDAKITIFALGCNCKRNAANLQRAVEMGMEIGNHTYNHVFHYQMEDAEYLTELESTELAINEALGYNYTCRFMRPPGGNGRTDPRLHAMLTQLGYKGVAFWSVSERDTSKVIKNAQPGDIMLYHTKDSDVKELNKVIPGLVAEGYKLVTLSELYGYGANETAPLDNSKVSNDTTLHIPYTYDEITFKSGTRMYGAWQFQKTLVRLGYLEENLADGVYGDGSIAAVKQLQTELNLTVTGEATPEFRKIVEEMIAEE